MAKKKNFKKRPADPSHQDQNSKCAEDDRPRSPPATKPMETHQKSSKIKVEEPIPARTLQALDIDKSNSQAEKPQAVRTVDASADAMKSTAPIAPGSTDLNKQPRRNKFKKKNRRVSEPALTQDDNMAAANVDNALTPMPLKASVAPAENPVEVSLTCQFTNEVPVRSVEELASKQHDTLPQTRTNTKDARQDGRMHRSRGGWKPKLQHAPSGATFRRNCPVENQMDDCHRQFGRVFTNSHYRQDVFSRPHGFPMNRRLSLPVGRKAFNQGAADLDHNWRGTYFLDSAGLPAFLENAPLQQSEEPCQSSNGESEQIDASQADVSAAIPELLDLFEIYSKTSDAAPITKYLSEHAHQKLVVQAIGVEVRSLFGEWCVRLGYSAPDYTSNNESKPPADFEASVIAGERLEKLIGLSVLIPKVLTTVWYEDYLEDIPRISSLVQDVREKSKDHQSLPEQNIHYQLNTAEDRFRCGFAISKQEVHELLAGSLNEDGSVFVSLAQKCPEGLYTADNVKCVLRYATKMVGIRAMDIRPLTAVYKVLSSVYSHLSELEREDIAVQFANNNETCAVEWWKILSAGLKATPLDTRRKTGTDDPIAHALLIAEQVDDFLPFMWMCAVMAPYTSAPYKEGLVKKLARVLIGDPVETPLEKRRLLLETLSKLPKPMRSILWNENGTFDSSLFASFHLLITEMGLPIFQKKGCCALKILCDFVSPSRILADSVIPCVSDPKLRGKAAAAVQVILSHDAFRKEILLGDSAVGIADVLKIGFDNYVEPDLSRTVALSRYPFMESIFKFVDSLFAPDAESPSRICEDVKNAFEGLRWDWYHRYCIIHLFFGDCQKRLNLLSDKIPQFTPSFESLRDLRFARILQSWPGELPRKALDAFVDEYLSACDVVLWCCVLLHALFAENSPLKCHQSFLYSFIKAKCAVETEETCSEKTGIASCEPVCNNMEDNDSSCDWLLVVEQCPEDLRSSILGLALKYPGYRRLASDLLPKAVETVDDGTIDAECKAVIEYLLSSI